MRGTRDEAREGKSRYGDGGGDGRALDGAMEGRAFCLPRSRRSRRKGLWPTIEHLRDVRRGERQRQGPTAKGITREARKEAYSGGQFFQLGEKETLNLEQNIIFISIQYK